MASTPPMQLMAEARTPPTPLHGSAYHDDSPLTRYNFRSSARRNQIASQPQENLSRFTKTPQSPRPARETSPRLHLTHSTPKQRTTRRVQVMSPPSPDQDFSTSRSKPSQPSWLSATTMMAEGMLPTPVKTPKKKTVQSTGTTGQMLFQDHLSAQSVVPSPRKARKTKRYNGFSLESFSADDNAVDNSVQIFTDSQDRVPEVDVGNDNPFLTTKDAKTPSSVRKMPTSKRRKIGHGKKLDPQVEEAIENDDGMVYVFRGKKVYRRFDDTGDEEEEIDIDDLGLLQHNSEVLHSTQPVRTMTRRSIKPTRLFKSEMEKQKREAENEDEAETEIEDNELVISEIHDGNAPVDQELDNDDSNLNGADITSTNEATISKVSNKGQKTSPFDSWARIKPGSRPAASPRSKGRKRTAADALDEGIEASSVKINKIG